MDTTSELANALGRKTMSARLGVGLKAISNAVVDGKFPPSWFFVCQAIAKEQGHDCPRRLFAFRLDTKSGCSGAEFQPAQNVVNKTNTGAEVPTAAC